MGMFRTCSKYSTIQWNVDFATTFVQKINFIFPEPSPEMEQEIQYLLVKKITISSYLIKVYYKIEVRYQKHFEGSISSIKKMILCYAFWFVIFTRAFLICLLVYSMHPSYSHLDIKAKFNNVFLSTNRTHIW